MKIIMGADPAGYDLKEAVRKDLEKEGYEIYDITPEAPLCYHEAAKGVAQGVQSGGI